MLDNQKPALMGYADRLSALQGETVDFYVSSPNGSFKADVWRLQSVDDRQGAPGRKVFPVEADLEHEYRGKEQKSSIGSYMEFFDDRGLITGGALTVVFAFLPTFAHGPAPQTLISIGHASNLALLLNGQHVELAVKGNTVATLPQPISNNFWYRIVFTIGRERMDLSLSGGSTKSFAIAPSSISHTYDAPLFDKGAVSHVSIAADMSGGAKRHFTGKIAELSFSSAIPNAIELAQIEDGRDAREVLGTSVWASWSFGRNPSQFTVPSLIEGGPTAILHNLPMRAVTGPNWTGRKHHFLLAEDEYNALLFHGDMVGGGDWERTLTLPVKDNWESGIYALRLSDGYSEDWIPFYVRPKENTSKAPIAFLAPTNTYLAYGNETNSLSEVGVAELSLMKDELVEAQAADKYVADHPELGLSIYDNHLDGAGVAYASRLRPLLNFRPFHKNWLNSSYRHFAADFYLIDWLIEKGFKFDVLTDEDLHLEGRPALDDYAVVLTGSHPEYVSERMLDAVHEYTANGGNLMYLGGNGFYWTTTFHPERPDLLEVRRGLTGARNWTSPPGEFVHAFSGEQGGIWRTKGRSPHRLTGIGMGAVGWGRASPYRIADGARSGERSWVFDGVDDDLVGDEGMMLDGAAGDEIDHVDFLHGTPAHTEILASSVGHSEYFQPVIEDYTNILPHQGGSKNPLVRADMTWLDVPGGGSVFSVGSICWIGCLPTNGYDNSVSRITENVLRRLGKLSSREG